MTKRLVDVDGKRQCKVCREIKPADLKHFPPAHTISGIGSTCRACYRAYQRAYKTKNSERLARLRRENYRLTKGAIVKARERRRQERAPLRTRAQSLRSGMQVRSRQRGLPFDAGVFTVQWIMDELEAHPSCPCCGIPFVLRSPNPGSKCDASPSVDRFYPSKGYVVGNVVILCWRCNNLKRDATTDELGQVVEWMDRFEWGLGVEAAPEAM